MRALLSIFLVIFPSLLLAVPAGVEPVNKFTSLRLVSLGVAMEDTLENFIVLPWVKSNQLDLLHSESSSGACSDNISIAFDSYQRVNVAYNEAILLCEENKLRLVLEVPNAAPMSNPEFLNINQWLAKIENMNEYTILIDKSNSHYRFKRHQSNGADTVEALLQSDTSNVEIFISYSLKVDPSSNEKSLEIFATVNSGVELSWQIIWQGEKEDFPAYRFIDLKKGKLIERPIFMSSYATLLEHIKLFFDFEELF